MNTKLNPNELDPSALGFVQAEVVGAHDLLERWVDHLEGKVATLFGLGALLIGIVPTLGNVVGVVQGWLLAVAGVAWIVLAVASFWVLAPAHWTSLTPATLLTLDWLALKPPAYQLYRTEFLADSLTVKRKTYGRKVKAFRVVLIGLAVEVAALTALVLVGVWE